MQSDGARDEIEIEIVEKAKQFGIRNVGFVVGAVFGLLAGAYGRFAARAAYEVRPNLADVGFVRALVTNHGHDWLFYNYPTVMTIFSVALVAVVIGFGWRSL